ncbi:hypothetical protein AB0E83_08315 [Streptomyces sp. NPDC035033]|uniref:hypothetical protein n=1 Tax=Streptomyces sp. NPDC035033 TaxID=3155368 RepID=UPI0033C887A0
MRRAAATGALLIGLTGCGGGDGTGATGGAAGEGQPVALDATGLTSALPLAHEIGDVYLDGETVTVQASEAQEFCASKTNAPCPGITGGGLKETVVRGTDDEIEFLLFSFGTEDEAAAHLGKLVAERKKAAVDGYPVKPVTIDSGADETQALQTEVGIDVYMRIGAVVSYVDANGVLLENAQRASKVQVDRIRTVAAGGTPGQ